MTSVVAQDQIRTAQSLCDPWKDIANSVRVTPDECRLLIGLQPISSEPVQRGVLP